MAVDQKAHWAARRALQAELEASNPSNSVLVTPQHRPDLNTTAGLPSEVSCENAARLLQAGTHLLSTASEAEEYRAHGERQLAMSEAQSLRNHGLSRVIFGGRS